MDTEHLLAALRAEIADLASGRLPLAVTKRRAAFELSISVRKLDTLISSGAVQTCLIGKVKMIPRDELLRMVGAKKSAVVPPRRSGPRPTSTRFDLAAEKAKLAALRKRR